MATTLQAPARNAPLTIVEMTMAARGAMENASGGTMNVPRLMEVEIKILAFYMDITLSSQQSRYACYLSFFSAL